MTHPPPKYIFVAEEAHLTTWRNPMKKKKTAKKVATLTTLQREIRRREAAVARNTRSIIRIRNLAGVEVALLEEKNRTHHEILNALKRG